ncbi:MAG TPA: methionine adenosyltransferase domain-containing protein, partial [Clostridia bacterium]|nr:methionine adenosyltransferase domain-containing protein [Clostridia bacterium]
KDQPVRAASVWILTQHQPDVELRKLREDLEECLVRHCVPANLLDAQTEIRINPAGPNLLGGLLVQTGVNGRNAALNAYGGHARFGSGTLSGRDPGRIERCGAYMARALAKAMAAYGAAAQCEVQVAYSAGREEPSALWVDTRGTGRATDAQLSDWIFQNYDLRRSAIVDCLQLRRPIYRNTAIYGHFGREADEFPWEMRYNRACGAMTMLAIS